MSYIVQSYVEMFTGLIIAHWRKREREEGGEGTGSNVCPCRLGRGSWGQYLTCCGGRNPAPMQWLLRQGEGIAPVLSSTGRKYPQQGDYASDAASFKFFFAKNPPRQRA
jgi:hypothetical protein